MTTAYLIMGLAGVIAVLLAVLLKQATTRGKSIEQLRQESEKVAVLKAQADIANRANVDRDELYARLRGRSSRIVPAVPADAS